MGPDIDCPECGVYKVRPGVDMCGVCEVAVRLGERIGQLESERDRLTAELDQLKARVAEVVAAAEESGWNGVENSKSLAGFIRGLAERIAELEAPPVVPEGWKVLQVPHEVDHQEYVDRWELWEQLDDDNPPFVVAFVRAGDVWCDSYALGNREAIRAFLWAIEHDQCPPHAGDEP